MADSAEPPPDERRPPLRMVATGIVRRLVEAGHVAYFAGGCVRDRLLGIEPTDYDIATDARPDAIQALFRRSHAVGEAFGVILVRDRGHTIEVATFRSDGPYTDARHPDSITFAGAEEDAARRDFTINGLFEDPITDRVIDHVDGRADLDARVIRAIGDPAARLAEDHLRALRAVRFAARFAFTIEAATAEAIRTAAPRLRGISRERIGHEVRRMLDDPQRAVAAWELQYLGLDAPVFEEPGRTLAPARVGRLPDEVAVPTALAAWVLDRHESDPAADLDTVAARWSTALMLSNDEKAGLFGALDVYRTLQAGWMPLGVARQKRLAVSPAFREGLELLRATDRPAFLEVRRRVMELEMTGLAPPPLLDGGDLIAMGLTPGPAFGRILDAVYDAQLESVVRDREAALALVRALAGGPIDDPGG